MLTKVRTKSAKRRETRTWPRKRMDPSLVVKGAKETATRMMMTTTMRMMMTTTRVTQILEAVKVIKKVTQVQMSLMLVKMTQQV